jgi:hypothetical protein
MWHLLVWLPILLLLALWSAGCALMHGLLRQLAHSEPATWLRLLDQWQIPLWLADRLPLAAISAFKAWLTELLSMAESLFTQWPALPDWLLPVLWTVWALGCAALLLTGLIGSVAVAAIVRSGKPDPRPA